MEEMLNAQLLLDVVTLGASLSACANGMAWELALAVDLQAQKCLSACFASFES